MKRNSMLVTTVAALFIMSAANAQLGVGATVNSATRVNTAGAASALRTTGSAVRATSQKAVSTTGSAVSKTATVARNTNLNASSQSSVGAGAVNSNSALYANAGSAVQVDAATSTQGSGTAGNKVQSTVDNTKQTVKSTAAATKRTVKETAGNTSVAASGQAAAHAGNQ